MELWELVVRERVRDTLARYNHAGDGGRIDELADCFLPDGVLEVKRRPAAGGRAEILALLSPPDPNEGPPAHGFVRHHLSSVRMEVVTAERVEASAYFLVLTKSGVDHWGRYRDVLAPSGEQWLFAHRRVTLDALAPHSYLRGTELDLTAQ